MMFSPADCSIRVNFFIIISCCYIKHYMANPLFKPFLPSEYLERCACKLSVLFYTLYIAAFFRTFQIIMWWRLIIIVKAWLNFKDKDLCTLWSEGTSADSLAYEYWNIVLIMLLRYFWFQATRTSLQLFSA
jgi:hypothetical protein